jgi:hypothetical protein
MGASKAASRLSGCPLRRKQRGELQSGQRRDRFGVHRISTGRIGLQAHVDHLIALGTSNAL